MGTYKELRRTTLSPDEPRQPPDLDFYMPATPPLALIAKLEFWVEIYRRRHHFRRLFEPLLKENDQILSDIGFERADIKWALKLPLKIDALKALSDCRRVKAPALPICNFPE
ncbi:hypothetical protein EHN06_02330 [Marinobacter sp. NP-4(2019)]|uniref:hypothetical protein n=1 Tax=Marinobacter sp. NP-4(2019) TaxID=2488665 RepID=UPI000FC3D75E|nr:hypothetical protein [Marinobacter sp. NP-4(2019)]AZT82468.1 hypothetical protein EHN06_02330 [Marinobacter sp. NP-4(2019)]